jgi:UDP-3-O-[3-hydroxymyristoyl] N-acetylglucosamine deacetylase
VQQQRTITEKVSCHGRGLHSGVPVQLTLKPARADTGIRFLRQESGRSVESPARPGAVTSTNHATSIAQAAPVSAEDAGPLLGVATVEHLMAALYALEIDNIVVELDGPEVPVMDGSAQPFLTLLERAGLYVQAATRPRLQVARRIEIVQDERRISVEPGEGFRISYAIDFDHPAIGRQVFEIPRFDSGVFEEEIAPARTFGFLEEVEALWRAGLARGGSLENTVVLDEAAVVNPEGLRFPDEFVRHKILDLVGDLALLGVHFDGHVRVERGGHALHHQLVCALLEPAVLVPAPQADLVDSVD